MPRKGSTARRQTKDYTQIQDNSQEKALLYFDLLVDQKKIFCHPKPYSNNFGKFFILGSHQSAFQKILLSRRFFWLT